ncbi:hypothetical protein Fmac_001576 [Flemingia macrophylla]|uniref:Retrotransposon Copia-like N-terminal domain-containing protein n=1 Tax=Flemingia macrophylla TaxID=520843 RepID=A0ABD1NHI4_9FABA
MEANTSTMVLLKGHNNYPLWRVRMKDLLYVNSLHEPVFLDEKPANKTKEEWSLLHSRVCGYIGQWVDDCVLNHISEETHARTLWQKLENLYAPKDGSYKVFLTSQMKTMRYQDGSNMADYLNEFQGNFNQLSAMGVKFEEEFQISILLWSLPESWGRFRMLWMDPILKGSMTMESVKNSLLVEYMQRKSLGGWPEPNKEEVDQGCTLRISR